MRNVFISSIASLEFLIMSKEQKEYPHVVSFFGFILLINELL